MIKKIIIVAVMGAAVLLGGCQDSVAHQDSTPEPAVLTPAPSAPTAAATPMAVPKTTPAVRSQPTRAAEAQPAAAGARVEVTKAVHDFGELAPDSINTCTFTFKNVGTDVLNIQQVQSTCGCSVPKLDKKEYQPGESGEVEVRFHAPAYKGNVTKHLYIVSNDTQNPRAQLEIKANVVVKVVVSPEQLELVYNKENGGIVPITVKSLDDQPFAITGITSTNNAVKAEFDPQEKKTEFVLNPTVDTEQLSKNPAGILQIAVNHPQAKQVLVQYRMQPRYVVTRPRIILQNANPGETEVKDVQIRSNYGESVEIESASSREGNMEVVGTEPLEGDALKVMVQIQIPPQPDGNLRYFSDVLKIKLKNGYETDINCNGWFKR